MAEGKEKQNDNQDNSGLEPVKKVRLYEIIVKQLQSLIINGTMRPGHKLPPERELAEELNVSRTSVREALRALEMMGYVESSVGMNGGTYVKEFTLSDIISPFSETLLQHTKFIMELLEVRLVLEVEGARLAAVRHTSDDIRELEAALKQMESEIDAGNSGVKGDNAFHLTLAKASHNRVLLEFIKMCSNLFEADLENHLENKARAKDEAMDHHRKMLEAIQNNDQDTCHELMEKHIDMVIRAIRKNREKRIKEQARKKS